MNNLMKCIATVFALLTLSIQTQANENNNYYSIGDRDGIENECSINESEILIIKDVISNLLSTEIAKNSFQLEHNAFNIELTIDEQGIVAAFRIIDGKATQDLLKHIELIVLGWQIEGLNPTDKLKLIIPILL